MSDGQFDSPLDLAEARRIEEYSLNASGAFQSLVYDGWLLGYRRGPVKRLRCVNPFYPSTLPLAAKVEHCLSFYREIGLPPLFRMLPFSQPADLDDALERSGWSRFDPTLVLHVDLRVDAAPSVPQDRVEMIPVPEWVEATASLLDLADENVPGAVERARSYPLPHAAGLIRRNGEPVACGLIKFEDDVAGLFALATDASVRGQGLGRAIVHALLEEARRRGARRSYLQVNEANAPAIELYRRFGFVKAYDYWYRTLAA